MFISTAKDVGLITSSENTQLQEMFSYASQKEMASMTSKEIVENIQEFNTRITTTAHLNHVLELIGPSFSFPLEERTTISNVLTIYDTWLFDDVQPLPIQSHGKHYFNIMLQHLSLIFMKRTYSTSQIIQHIELCTKVLDIFEKALTWKYVDLDLVIRLLIGGMIALGRPTKSSISSVITANTSSSFYKVKDKKKSLSDAVSGRTIHLLYRSWLMLQPTDVNLWKTLSLYHKDWCLMLPVTIQWKDFVISLCNCVLKSLYEQADCIVVYQPTQSTFKTSQSPLSFCEKTPLDLYYAQRLWITILHAIGHPMITASSRVFETIITSFQYQINSMINYKVSGQTILRIFSILFKCVVFPSHPRYENGVALSVSNLSQIFIASRSYTSFSSSNITMFYHALSHALISESEKVYCAALNAFAALSATEFDVRCLIKTALHAVLRALFLKEPHLTELKPTMLKTLTYALSVSPTLQIKFVPVQPVDDGVTISSLLARNLYLFFKREIDPAILSQILALLHRFFMEHLPYCNKQYRHDQHLQKKDDDNKDNSKYVKSKERLGRKFKTSYISTKPPNDAGELAWYFLRVVHINHSSLFIAAKPDIHRSIFDIVILLIRYSKHIPGTTSFLNEVFTVITELFGKWDTAENLVIMADCIAVVTEYVKQILPTVSYEQYTKVTSLYKNLTSVNGYAKKRTLLRLSALPLEGLEYYTMALSQSIAFQHHHMMGPPLCVAPSNSPSINELSIFHKMGLTLPSALDQLLLATVDNTLILTFIDLKPDILVIERDARGKSIHILKSPQTTLPQFKTPICKSSPPTLTTITLPHDKVLPQLHYRTSPPNLTEYIGITPPSQTPPKILPIPTFTSDESPKNAPKTSFLRRFVSAIGISTPSYWRRLTPLKATETSIRALAELDKVSPRLSFNVTLATDEITTDFAYFLKTISSLHSADKYHPNSQPFTINSPSKSTVKVSKTESIDKSIHDNVVFSYSDDFTEIQFYCPKLGQTTPSNSSVFVGFNTTLPPSNDEQLQILITPLGDSLFDVRSSHHVASLVTQQTVRLEVLPQIIRSAAITYVTRITTHELDFPYDSRCIAIQDFSTTHCNKQHPLCFMELLFDRGSLGHVSLEKFIDFDTKNKALGGRRDKLIEVKSSTPNKSPIPIIQHIPSRSDSGKSKVIKTTTIPTTPKK
ncbi:Ral GTPase-activating protein subunit alpha/beta N-terminal domain-containing protein [Entamoeba marina]